MSEPRWWFLIGLVCGCAEEKAPPEVTTNEQEFGGAHEDIMESALAFLREDVLDDIKDEHGWADDGGIIFDGVNEHVRWLHVDGCAFGETIEQINQFYSDAVVNIVPGSSFDPRSATDDFGRVFHPAQDFYSHSNWVDLGFPANDDPTTSSIEISSADLVNFATTFAGPSGLGPWGWGGSMSTVRANAINGDIKVVDMVDVTLWNDGEGALDQVSAVAEPDFPSTYRFGLLPDPNDPDNPDTAGFVPGLDTDGVATFRSIPTAFGEFDVPVMTSGHEYRLLISAVGDRPVGDIVGNQCDPFARNAAGERTEFVNTCAPDQYIDSSDPLHPVVKSRPDFYSCIAYHGSPFALSHDGVGGSGLNKDSDDAGIRFRKARALAYLQTQYEWCRFVSKAGENDQGGDGPLLALWVRENGDANPQGTPCYKDDGRGPMGVTVTVDTLEVLDDKDEGGGKVNLSLALYDDPSNFHRLDKSDIGPFDVTAPATIFTPGFAPVTQCVRGFDTTFRVALHGWDDDDTFGANGDYGDDDDAIVGFTEKLDAATIPIGSPLVRTTSSHDLRVTYRVTRVADTDTDGLDACGEDFYQTDPNRADTDSDQLADGLEVNGANPTSPRLADTDGDGLDDGQEDANHNGALDPGETNPNDTDSDNDLLPDGIEVNGSNPTNPLDADTDDDGLTDGQEDANGTGGVDAGETNPNDADSDDDGLGDGLEVSVGTNPLDPDSDDDGLPDGRDTDWIESAIAALPDSVLKHPNNRKAMVDLLDDAEKLAKKGNVNAARDKLLSLRGHLDGCGAASDPNDWIIDCTTQLKIRALVDVLFANL